MKTKQSLFFLIFVSQFGFSQTFKLIQGKVLYGDFPLQGIEIVNLVTKKSAKTDSNGIFSISVKADDVLVFVSEKYDYKRLLLDKECLASNNFTILLNRKPEQLEEVVVISKISFPHIGYNQEYADQSKLEKAANNPKPIGVYDGTLTNSPDLMRIGGVILNLFVKPKEKNSEAAIKNEFKEVVKNNYPQTFFINTLKVKPDDVALFIEFCAANNSSKAVLENYNPLKLLDFLISKKIEFDKMLGSVNK